jgi:hypothetical protein
MSSEWIKKSRPRCERPRGSHTAEQRDEIAAFHQQILPCFEPDDSTAGDLLHCGISIRPMSAAGHERRIGAVRNISALPP